MTWAPSDEELESCRIVTVTDEHNWDPSRVVFSAVRKHDSARYSDIYALNARLSSLSLSCDIPVLHSDVFCDVPDFSAVSSVSISSAVSDARHHGPDPRILAKSWDLSIQTAKATLDATTQLNIRSAVAPLSRRYRTDLLSMKLRRLDCKFFTDTLFSKSPSILGHTCAQIYYDPNGFMYIHPMVSKREAGESLDALVNDVGIPNKMVFDGAAEQVGKKSVFDKRLRHYRISPHRIEPYTPWQNKAESGIRIIKAKWKRLMISRMIPRRLWDFALVWISQIYTRSAGKSGRTGYEIITGDTPDISEWTDFSFYDWVWYWHTPGDVANPRLGRWLGVSHRIGSALCYWILHASGRVISRTTVQHVLESEMETPDVQNLVKSYNEQLSWILGDNDVVLDMDGFHAFINEDEPDPFQEVAEETDVTPDIDAVVDNTDAERAADTYHSYVGAEVILPDATGNRRMARVLRRVQGNVNNDNQSVITNPLLDTSVFEVQFPDGTVDRLNANVIAENLLSQVDEQGRQFQVLSEIVEHQKDGTAILPVDGYVWSKYGNKHPKKTTRGWKLLVEWRDGSTSWVPLKDLKASNPVELAEYALANNLADEPAFKWWVPHTIRVRDRIVSKVKSKYWRTTHKFGIRIPKTVEEAFRIDEETGTTFWRDAIAKELAKVRVAFEVSDIPPELMRKGQVKPGYQEIKCHWVFDVKMDGLFTRKARLVAGGHTTEAPATMTYSSVVSRDSIRLAFLIAALNDIGICAADVGNAYLNAPCKEKIWTVAGLEFGSEAGSTMFIVRALYGLKSSGASWASMLSDSLRGLGYTPSEADRNVWMKPGVKPDGFKYYQYILVYVDDILHLSHDPTIVISALSNMYELKKESVGIPERYLGANVERVQISDGRSVWAKEGQS